MSHLDMNGTNQWGDYTSSAAAVMAHSKLTSEAGMASAASAAQQAKLRAQKKHQQELHASALTAPQQRSQAQVELLCDFLSSSHLLHNLQPTAVKALAGAMMGQAFSRGDIIYRQGDPAKHFYVVLSGEVAMFEQEHQQLSPPSTASSSAASAAVEHAFAAAIGANAASTSEATSGHSSRIGSSQGPRGHSSLKNSRANTPGGPRPGSPALRGSSAGSASAAGAGTGTGAGAGAGGMLQQLEVRRVAPREAFGEDDVTAGSLREQTAVAGGAVASTFGRAAGSSAYHSSSTIRFVSHGGASSYTSTSGSKTSNDSGGISGTGTAAGNAVAAGMGADSSSTGQMAAADAVPAPGMAAVAVAAADSSSQVLVLMLSAEDYGAVMEGRLSNLLEEKVAFLAELPAMQGLSIHYLRSLSHCFHQVRFEPREAVVHQGHIADCMYVLKSGQVCVLIEPTLTLNEVASSSGSGSAAAFGPPAASSSSGGSGGSAVPGSGSNEVDTKRLVQVCLLGSGAIIGDMSVRETAAGPPRRSATVVALTELFTFKVPLKEFKRRMPAEVLEGMRQVANDKFAMNERHAQSRALLNGKDGHVLLGGAVMPESVLRGKGLRALMEARDGVVPVGGLLQALELYFGGAATKQGSNGPGNNSGSNKTKQPGKMFVVGEAATKEVEGFVDSLSRSGFLSAPPQEFLALLTDWRSPRKNTGPAPSQPVPRGWLFPLPIPSKQHKEPVGKRNGTGSPPRPHPVASMLASLAHTTNLGPASSTSTWHQSNVHTCAGSPPRSPLQDASLSQSSQVQFNQSQWQYDQRPYTSPAGGTSSATAGAAATAGSAGHVLLASPTSLLAALSLDQYAQQRPTSASPCGRGQGSRSATPAGDSPTSGSSKLNVAAVAKDATYQLLSGYLMSTGLESAHAAGGGFRGALCRRPQSPGGTVVAETASLMQVAAAGTAGSCAPNASLYNGCMTISTSSPEPSLHEATIKASTLFRPGSPICIGRCGSARPKSASSGVRVATAARRAAATVSPATKAALLELGPNINAAVVMNKGKLQLAFHDGAVAVAGATVHHSQQRQIGEAEAPVGQKSAMLG